MATGTIFLLPGNATPPDGSASNAAPALTRVQGTETAPKKHFLVAGFDATTAEHLWWIFPMPADYASGGTVVIHWYANATTGSAVWAARFGAVTPADADTPLEHAQAAASTVTTATNVTEANRLNTSSITLANLDSVAASDMVSLVVYRDAANGSDGLSVDANLIEAQLAVHDHLRGSPMAS